MTVDCFVSLLFIDGLSSYVSFPFFSFYFNTAFASILFSQTFRFILFDGIQRERERENDCFCLYLVSGFRKNKLLLLPKNTKLKIIYYTIN